MLATDFKDQDTVWLTNNVETELRKFQAHKPELVFRLGTEDVRPVRPERCDWLSDSIVLLCCSRINVSGVCNLALCAGIDAVNCDQCQ
jgi:hypothetical protein